ncbi:hypothetical protein BV22DRAFT_1033439 [Leucogyrophana mollusca]|uniref:Uncharacterized protein n=1 Tax=Leucogyrophana mollusca TaxID=85980 RepID=A0ACB8BL63_9AGAM|nr:hypothetical protein BV22DRAFT_1033439 [Leucogyrophana mollusca]
MSDVSAALNWGPGLIGLAFSLGMYGVALGQYGFYMHAFPLDPRALKMLVLFVFILDTLQSYGMVAYNWVLLIPRHHNDNSLVLPWEAPMAAMLSYCTTVVVQSFYAHRLWIISGHNKLITAAVVSSVG